MLPLILTGNGIAQPLLSMGGVVGRAGSRPLWRHSSITGAPIDAKHRRQCILDESVVSAPLSGCRRVKDGTPKDKPNPVRLSC